MNNVDALHMQPSPFSSARTLVAIAFSSILLTVGYWSFSPPEQQRELRVSLQGPYSSEGVGFTVPLDIPGVKGDSPEQPNASPVELLEEQKPLGPAHAQHATVRTVGKGAYSHWGSTLYFSTSDNSDPNQNGRRYTIRYLDKPRTLLHAVTLFGTGFLSLLGILAYAASPVSRFPRIKFGALIFLSGIVIIGLIEGAARLLLAHSLVQQRPFVQTLYQQTFVDSTAGKSLTAGMSFFYRQHHYLNYALNPEVPYLGARQFNSEYLIRRTEPIRPGPSKGHRVLAIGGSTTFDEGISDERDTWVWNLERLLRETHGESVEVINGGVGGYTLVENFIHYVTLLSSLAPDTVLLYVGINDVHPRFFGTIAEDYSNYRKPWDPRGYELPKVSPLLKQSFTYRYYFLRSKLERLAASGIGGVTAHQYPPSTEWEAGLQRNSSATFERHLSNFVALILAQGRRVILVPQHYLPKGEEKSVYAKGVSEHNEAMRRVAQANSVPFLEAVVTPGTFDHADTWDSCHFNEVGARKMAEVIFEATANTLILAEPTRHPGLKSKRRIAGRA